jgi:hypothetical protein
MNTQKVQQHFPLLFDENFTILCSTVFVGFQNCNSSFENGWTGNMYLDE